MLSHKQKVFLYYFGFQSLVAQANLELAMVVNSSPVCPTYQMLGLHRSAQLLWGLYSAQLRRHFKTGRSYWTGRRAARTHISLHAYSTTINERMPLPVWLWFVRDKISLLCRFGWGTTSNNNSLYCTGRAPRLTTRREMSNLHFYLKKPITSENSIIC